ncbi:S-adenosylmethionine decarboxylase proenzyme-like [Anneissia japonica]|uniref:S-adenosylmethionine decarboxylase proenzyme-like n=1 Tax=Anneissia japonica TaxID=1529436 RepID=UPI0014257D31|nr:S-adenosylmethionine decarboxylase proenzyme-like [Anneissia japonica]
MAASNNGMPCTNQVTHYEGAEKLFEIWFEEHNSNDGSNDLRKIPRCEWEQMLKRVNCEIISEMFDSTQCSYILSESSMFVAKRRFILKTCGTTTPLDCIPTLLKVAEKYCGFTKVEDVFYSRKNFIRPDLQDRTYQRFEEEVKILENYFPGGAAYVLGRLNGDCWYERINSFLTLHKCNGIQIMNEYVQKSSILCIFQSLHRPLIRLATRKKVMTTPFPTLTLALVMIMTMILFNLQIYILMTDLDEDVMALFQKSSNLTATEVTKASGISELLPDCSIDATMFDPCGYSMNGLMTNGEYMTIHITPEKEWSYVSFETNAEMPCYDDLVKRILETFKPGKFVMTVFANKVAKCVSSYHALRESFHDGFKRQDRQFSQFKSYDLTFGHYTKEEVIPH